MPFTIIYEQIISKNNLCHLRQLIGKHVYFFVFEGLHNKLSSKTSPNNISAITEIIEYKWKGIINQASKDKVIVCNINIPSPIFPFNPIGKEVEFQCQIVQSMPQLREKYFSFGRLAFEEFGVLKKIQIFNHKMSYKELDVQTLFGDYREKYFPNAPKEFNYLVQAYN